MENDRISVNYANPSMDRQQMHSTRIFICPSTGGSFQMNVGANESVHGLKWSLSRRLNLRRDRIILLHRNRQLKNGLLRDYCVADDSCITLLPSLETGISYHRRESGVMEALRTLTDAQINDFLSGHAPLVLAMRLGDHMMFIQLQLSTTPCSRARPRPSPRPTPVTVPPREQFTVQDHQEVPSPTYIPESSGNNLQSNLHQFRHFPDNEKTCPVSPVLETNSPPRGGAVIESMKHLGKGVYSGTFSGTIDRSLQDRNGCPKRDINTIVHILNDLLEAAPQYRQHCFVPRPQNVHTSPATSSNIDIDSVTRSNIPTEDDSRLRGKVRHLQMMMEERKLRRRARRNARGPYQWQRKGAMPTSFSSNEHREKPEMSADSLDAMDNEDMHDSYTPVEQETLAV
ncbi:hypothetical protein FSP39_021668 [Pinctada imbricata]|uniref:Midnolin n=1 Tax=Pinctada imbricata TaxID=66713 RepID=A0AA88Y8Z4_PINIB|nr:hypothetical protein FSP39_021668 [Pinctada imbricata]